MRPLVRAAPLRQPWLLPRHPRSRPQSLVPRRIATTCARHAAPVDLPRLAVKHGHKAHSSLATFIAYADRTRLAPASTTYIGTHYEYTAALALLRLGFSLLRTGGKNDAGIDLIGHWVLAPLSDPLPVIIQCKARKHSLGPSNVRELEGSFRGIPPDWKGQPVLGLLVTTLKATKGVMEAIGRSPWPMGFVMVSRHGLIQQFVWNRAASERGLQGVGVTMRHTPRALLPAAELLAEEEADDLLGTSTSKKRPSKYANTGTRRDVQLTWMGSPIFPDRNTLDKDTVSLIHRAEPVMEIKPSAPLGQPRRGRGRPKKEQIDDAVTAPKGRKGPKPTLHLAPVPRGGQIAVPRGPAKPTQSRSKVSKAKAKAKPPKDAG